MNSRRERKRCKIQAMTDLEAKLGWILATLGPQKLAGPAVEQFRPLKGRRYTLDFAYPEFRVGCECQGGIWARRRHPETGRRLGSAHTGMGHERDMEKLNVLQAAGWVILQFSTKMIEEDPYGVARTVCDALIMRARSGVPSMAAISAASESAAGR